MWEIAEEYFLECEDVNERVVGLTALSKERRLRRWCVLRTAVVGVVRIVHEFVSRKWCCVSCQEDVFEALRVILAEWATSSSAARAAGEYYSNECRLVCVSLARCSLFVPDAAFASQLGALVFLG